eukprot:m.104003 g.104003  ORF g.104003 m.104003 type:complete len:1560 (+) comp15614_c0_seq1:465-5144(+)
MSAADPGWQRRARQGATPTSPEQGKWGDAHTKRPSPLSTSPSALMRHISSASDFGRSTPIAAQLERSSLVSQQVRWSAFALAIAALALAALAEFYPLSANSIGMVMTLSSVAMLWAAPLTTVAGLKLYPGQFQVYMPFQGGFVFVLFQGFGWALCSLNLMVSLIYASNPVSTSVRGLFLANSLLGFFGHCLLNISLDSFAPGNDTACITPGSPGPARNLRLDFAVVRSHLMRGESLTSLTLSATGFLALVACDQLRQYPWAPIAFRLSALQFCFAAFITHALHGWKSGQKRLIGYKLFQPFEGGFNFLLFQSFSWFFLALVLLAVLVLADRLSFLRVNGVVSSVGALGLFSQVLLVLSLLLFEGEASKAPNHHTSKASRKGRLRLGGTMRLSVVFAVSALVLFFIAHHHSKFVSLFAVFEAVEKRELLRYACVMMLLDIPITHVGGLGMYFDYKIWQPFTGGVQYVCAQAFAWWLYAVLLLAFGVLLPWADHPISDFYLDTSVTLPVLASLSLLGWAVMFWSVLLYKSPTSTQQRKNVAGVHVVLGADIWVSLVMSGIACAVYMVIDRMLRRKLVTATADNLDGTNILTYSRVMLAACTAAFALSALVAHVGTASKNQGFKIWAPFQGPTYFVIAQALAWTWFATGMLAQLLFLLSPPSTDLVIAENVPYLLTFLGVFSFAAQVGLVLSVAWFWRPDDRNAPKVRLFSWPLPSVVQLEDISKDLEHLQRCLELVKDRPVLTDVLQSIQAQYAERKTVCNRHLADPSWQPEHLFSDASLASYVIVAVSTFLFCAADVLRLSYPDLVWVLVACTIAAELVAACWTHFVYGPHKHPGTYKYFMPFAGGAYFVLLQCLGWVFVTLASLLGLTALSLPSGLVGLPFTLGMTGVGIVYLAGQLCILNSLPYFKPATPAGSTSPSGVGRQRRDAWRPKIPIENFLSLLISLGSFVLFGFADFAAQKFGPSFPVLPTLVCAVIAASVAVPLAYVVSPRFQSKQYEITRVMERNTVTQIFGWTLWSGTVVFGLNICHDNWNRDSITNNATIADDGSALTDEHMQPQLSSFWAGAIGFVAQILVLVSLESPSLLAYPKALVMNKRVKTVLKWFVVTVVFTLLLQHPVLSFVRCRLPRVITWLAQYVQELFSQFFYALAALVSALLARVGIRWPARTAVWVVGLAVQVYVAHLLLPNIRFFIDWPMGRLYASWWKWCKHVVSQDNQQVMEGIEMEQDIRYGPLPSETMDILRKKPLPPAHSTKCCPMVYVHGGGFVAVTRKVLVQSVSCLVRHGPDVLYSMDYPLSPDHRFPTALFSLLRACAFAKRHSNCTELDLYGDSAGGTIVTTAAAVLSSAKLRRELTAQLKADGQDDLAAELQAFDFPTIRKVICVYGVLDRHSWQGTWMGLGLHFCVGSYENEKGAEYFDGRLTLCDYALEDLADYPDTLLIGAASDALVDSSSLAHDHLLAAGRKSKLLVFPGFHSFMGLPVQWTLGDWKHNQLPATEQLLSFVSGKEVRLPGEDVAFDWTVVLVMSLVLVAYGACFFFIWQGLTLTWESISQKDGIDICQV